jgi:hypothetical protein
MTHRRFSRARAAAIDRSAILAIRAGRAADHRFIGIWAVVIDRRVFVRGR